MKNVVFMALVLAAASAFAAANDSLVKFWTEGPDTYQDGATVKDGECYVLVWTKTGSTFDGFYADGTVGADSEIFRVAPIAANGCCPSISFQLGGEKKTKCSQGSLALYLLDTRNADTGEPAGVQWNGKYVFPVVNGWGHVTGAAIEVDGQQQAQTSSIDEFSALKGSSVGNQSLIPENAPKAGIAGIKVADGKVVVSVTNTASYLSYNLAGGETPDTVSEANKGKGVQGNGSKIEIEREATSDSGFFKLIRN